MKEFDSESEERSRIWETEKSKDYDVKIDNLEKKMDKKHSELLTAMCSMLQNVGRGQQQVTFAEPGQGTYASAAAGSHHGSGQVLGQAHHQGRGNPAVHGFQSHLQVPSSPGWGIKSGQQASQRMGRSRSPSTKRIRNEDGSVTEVVRSQSNQRNIKHSGAPQYSAGVGQQHRGQSVGGAQHAVRQHSVGQHNVGHQAGTQQAEGQQGLRPGVGPGMRQGVGQGVGQGVQQQKLFPNLSNMNLWNVLCGPGVPNPNL